MIYTFLEHLYMCIVNKIMQRETLFQNLNTGYSDFLLSPSDDCMIQVGYWLFGFHGVLTVAYLTPNPFFMHIVSSI